MTNELYDKLRFIFDRLLPALGTLYFTIGQVVPIPYPEVVVGIITALVCFGDEILAYFKGKYDKLNGSNKIVKYNDDEIAEDAKELING